MAATGYRVAVVRAALVLGLFASGCSSESVSRDTSSVSAEATTTTTAAISAVPATTAPPPTTAPPTPTVPTTAPIIVLRWPADQKALEPVATITGQLSPKSVVASGTGLYFAQNMMYWHTISIFDSDKQLLATLPDTVDLKAFGYEVPVGVYQGAPVEAVFSSDGSYAFVSNYRMYGPGYDPNAGSDSCEKDRGQDSFVYRIDTRTLEIDRLYPVGPVPKFLAVTPDDRLLLVSNWCGFDVSVIDLQTHETLTEMEVGRHPRGVAVTSDSAIAYVAVMGSTDIAVIDLSVVSSSVTQPGAEGEVGAGGEVGAEGEVGALSYLRDVGRSPRHLVLSPDDEILYVSLNGDDAVVALDADTGEELQRAHTGRQPRSIDISDDGTALYVVNYESDTMTKVRTSDFSELQSFDTAERPIGITYDSFSDEVWVSAYSGVIHVYAETEPVPKGMCTAFGCNVDIDNDEAGFDSLDLEPSSRSRNSTSSEIPD